jgi:hypothetical protein
MKAGAMRWDRNEAKRRHFIPALVAAAGLILTAGVAVRWQSQPQAAYPVNLTAMRANTTAIAPAGRALELHPDLTGLAASPSYSVEIVNVSGQLVWRGDLTLPRATVIVPGQPRGAYFIRIYLPVKQLLREYALQIGT